MATRRSPTERASSADLRKVLGELPRGTSADVRLITSAWTTIRFANGRIHQPHLERSTRVSFRAADGRRLASATGSDVSLDGLRSLSETARVLARVAPLERKFRGFPAPTGRAPPKVPFSTATARVTPEAASRVAADLLDSAVADAPGARVAGVLSVGTEEVRVANSEGIDRSSVQSAASASVLVQMADRDPPVSGWSEGAHWDLAKVGVDHLGHEAAARMARVPPAAVSPGAYPVVLRGPAVSELLRYLAHLGFGANGEVEGWSCLLHQRGKKVAPDFVNLEDDARSPETVPQGIDYEGVWTTRTPLVTDGVAGEVVTDALTAGRLGRSLTGHASPPEAPWGDFGPEPSHLLLAPGDATEAELVHEVRRGLLVTRFHYIRVVDPGRGVLTGMTRDGTYVIENGEVVRPARNLRFTESVLTALSGVTALGRERRTYLDGGSAVTTPGLAVNAFRFTSATLF